MVILQTLLNALLLCIPLVMLWHAGYVEGSHTMTFIKYTTTVSKQAPMI